MFGFFLLVVVVALLVFVALGGLVFKWDPTRAQYVAKAGSGSDEE